MAEENRNLLDQGLDWLDDLAMTDVTKVDFSKVDLAKLDPTSLDWSVLDPAKWSGADIARLGESNIEVLKSYFPKFDWPSLSLDSLRLEKLSLGNIELPKVELPKIELPDIEFPDFDLKRFRDLAFGTFTEPDHPMHSEEAARALLAEVKAGDPLAGMAELTHWTHTLTGAEGFTAERRASVLMLIDDAARKCWRELGARYLAPGGKPSVGRDGNPAILAALFESAAEFAEGYGQILLDGDDNSTWVRERWSLLAVRRARWLGRRLILAYMLRRPEAAAIWEAMHVLYVTAESRQASRTLHQVFPGDPHQTSIKQEYIRLLLVEMADVESMRPRQIELAYRVAQRFAIATRLEAQRHDRAVFVVVPSGVNRPVLVSRLARVPDNALYLDTVNCLPRMQAMLVPDSNEEERDADRVFGKEFSVGERFDIVRRLQLHWGDKPPERAERRTATAIAAHLRHGFESVSQVLPLSDQGSWTRASTSRREDEPSLQIMMGDEAKVKEHARETAARPAAGRILDSSIGGMGVEVSHHDALRIAVGHLVAVNAEGGPRWIIGAARWIAARGAETRLGIQVLTRKPSIVWCKLEADRRESVWDQELWRERDFGDLFVQAIMIDADINADHALTLLFAPNGVERGGLLDVPLALGVLKLEVTSVGESNESFMRVTCQPRGLTPYRKKRAAQNGFDGWQKE